MRSERMVSVIDLAAPRVIASGPIRTGYAMASAFVTKQSSDEAPSYVPSGAHDCPIVSSGIPCMVETSTVSLQCLPCTLP